MKKEDSDLISVLKDDGLTNADWETMEKYQNATTINLEDIRKELGMGSWAVRIAYNNAFGGVVIQQCEGEGNRKHYHPDADENWVILDGCWEWWIEGMGLKKVCKGDIVVVPRNTWHQITCISKVGARYAITKPDVNHVYE
jgi:quercetin dioxygenase-like cupin family protein